MNTEIDLDERIWIMVQVTTTTSQAFSDRIKNESIVCFCAGKALEEFYMDYPDAIYRTKYIVDNKQNEREYKVGDTYIPIIKISEVQQEDIVNSIIIISSIKYADEIIKQIDKVEMFNGIKVYIPCLFKEEITQYKEKRNKNIIPKIIHYCWFGKSPIPKKFQDNIDTWKANCPDYEIKLWNETNYDIEKNQYMKQAYETKKWGFVPDYARLDIVNTYGGIYMDTDVQLVKNLDNLLQYELFCGFESRKYVAFGLGFGGIKDHPIFKDMLEIYKKMSFINDDGSLNMIASPFYQTQVLKQHGLVCNGRTQKHSNYIVFSSEYFSPINSFGYGEVTSNTYSIHQYAATWFEQADREDKQRIIASADYVQKRMKNNN